VKYGESFHRAGENWKTRKETCLTPAPLRPIRLRSGQVASRSLEPHPPSLQLRRDREKRRESNPTGFTCLWQVNRIYGIGENRGSGRAKSPYLTPTRRSSFEAQRNPEWYGWSATPLKSNGTDPVQRTAKASFSYSLHGPARLPVLEHWEPRSAGLLRWCVPRPLAQRLCERLAV